MTRRDPREREDVDVVEPPGLALGVDGEHLLERPLAVGPILDERPEAGSSPGIKCESYGIRTWAFRSRSNEFVWVHLAIAVSLQRSVIPPVAPHSV